VTLGSDGLGGLDWTKESEVRSENESEEEEETYLELLGQVKVVREVLLAKRSLQQTTKAACQSGERARTDTQREREREGDRWFRILSHLAGNDAREHGNGHLNLLVPLVVARDVPEEKESEVRSVKDSEEDETYLKSRMKASDPALSIFLPVTVVAVQ